jgi:tRNA modification GTPase
LASSGGGERLREGLVVAIAGPPNAGKSTLLNRLARREAAIVSPHPGTTRDVIKVHLDLAGYPVTLLDTAGIRDSDDPVEQEGVRRARGRAATADLVLWVTDLSAAGEAGSEPENKIDLAPDHASGRNESQSTKTANQSFAVSATKGAGVEGLIVALTNYAKQYFAQTEATVVTRVRHREALEQTVAALDRALGQSKGEELIAEELRSAATTLGRLTGRVDVEDILDVIFRDFCIGK